MNWLDLLKTLVPILIPIINPKLSALAPIITTGIGDAEGLVNASGTRKLDTVVTLATDTANGINAATGKTVIDPTALGESAANTISAVVDIVNLVHKSQTTQAA